MLGVALPGVNQTDLRLVHIQPDHINMERANWIAKGSRT
jgi:hypothetical protein